MFKILKYMDMQKKCVNDMIDKVFHDDIINCHVKSLGLYQHKIVSSYIVKGEYVNKFYKKIEKNDASSAYDSLVDILNQQLKLLELRTPKPLEFGIESEKLMKEGTYWSLGFVSYLGMASSNDSVVRERLNKIRNELHMIFQLHNNLENQLCSLCYELGIEDNDYKKTVESITFEVLNITYFKIDNFEELINTCRSFNINVVSHSGDQDLSILCIQELNEAMDVTHILKKWPHISSGEALLSFSESLFRIGVLTVVSEDKDFQYSINKYLSNRNNVKYNRYVHGEMISLLMGNSHDFWNTVNSCLKNPSFMDDSSMIRSLRLPRFMGLGCNYPKILSSVFMIESFEIANINEFMMDLRSIIKNSEIKIVEFSKCKISNSLIVSILCDLLCTEKIRELHIKNCDIDFLNFNLLKSNIKLCIFNYCGSIYINQLTCIDMRFIGNFDSVSLDISQKSKDMFDINALSLSLIQKGDKYFAARDYLLSSWTSDDLIQFLNGVIRYTNKHELTKTYLKNREKWMNRFSGIIYSMFDDKMITAVYNSYTFILNLSSLLLDFDDYVLLSRIIDASRKLKVTSVIYENNSKLADEIMKKI